MNDIAINVGGRDAHVQICWNSDESAHASAVVLDENGATVTETRNQRFSGFCDAEMAYQLLSETTATRRGIEHDDIRIALDTQGVACRCE